MDIKKYAGRRRHYGRQIVDGRAHRAGGSADSVFRPDFGRPGSRGRCRRLRGEAVPRSGVDAGDRALAGAVRGVSNARARAGQSEGGAGIARKIVERAKGVLMEVHGLRESEAFHRIRKTSVDRKSMREVVEAILLTHEMDLERIAERQARSLSASDRHIQVADSNSSGFRRWRGDGEAAGGAGVDSARVMVTVTAVGSELTHVTFGGSATTGFKV